MEKKSLKELKEEERTPVAWSPISPPELVAQAENPLIVVERNEDGVDAVPPLKETIREDTTKLAEALQSSDIAEWLEQVARKMVSLLDPRQGEAFAEFCRQTEASYSAVLMSMLRRACELRDFPYFPDIYWVHQKASHVTARTFCKNCGLEIPQGVARWGQLFCCNHCAAYHNGSRLVMFDSHSEGCPLAGESWRGMENPFTVAR